MTARARGVEPQLLQEHPPGVVDATARRNSCRKYCTESKGFPVRESSKQPDPFFVQLATCVGDTIAWCRLIADQMSSFVFI